jgi:hypothetical protein
MEPEEFCLPPRERRFWVVPLVSDKEEKKVADFSNLDDGRVLTIDSTKMPGDVIGINAVHIRQLILSGSSEWKNLVPEAAVRRSNQIRFEEKVRQTYKSGGIRPKTNIASAIIADSFCPPLKWHFELAHKLLKEYDSVTFAVITLISDLERVDWPTFQNATYLDFLNYWERNDLIQIGAREFPGLSERVIVCPLFGNVNGSYAFQRALFLSTKWGGFGENLRKWYFRQNEHNRLADYLLRRGESVSYVEGFRSDQSAEEARRRLRQGLSVDMVPKDVERELRERQLEVRLRVLLEASKCNAHREETATMGEIKYFCPVTVLGDNINIGGNQFNVITADKERVFKDIIELLNASHDVEGMISAIRALEPLVEQRSDISSSEISDYLRHHLPPDSVSPPLGERLGALARELSVGASGSILAAGIVEGVKMFL